MGADPAPGVLYCSAGIAVRGGGDLEADGWVRRTVGDRSRLEELRELYSSLGFETAVADLDPATFGGACTACAVSATSECTVLFTRGSGLGS